MKFLCVFCAVLYLQSGACLYPVDNSAIVSQQPQRNVQINDQRREGIPGNLARRLDNNSTDVNYQTQTPIQERPMPIKTFNEPYIGQREIVDSRMRQISTPNYPPEINNMTPNQDKNINRIQQEFLPLPVYPNKYPVRENEGDIKENLQPITYKTSRIPSVKVDNTPFRSDKDIRLGLENVSPEYIKSSIDEQRPQQKNNLDPSQFKPSPQNVGDRSIRNPPLQTDYKNQPTANFTNPSAESLYKLNQARPYRINTPFFNQPQGNAYQNQPLINLKRVHDIYKSEQPKRRYTIIHTDGRVEHTDDASTIFARHPNYILLKSGDVMKHAQNIPNTFPEVNPTVAVKPVNENIQESNVVKQANNRKNSAPLDINTLSSPKRTNMSEKDINAKNSMPVVPNTNSTKLLLTPAIVEPVVRNNQTLNIVKQNNSPKNFSNIKKIVNIPKVNNTLSNQKPLLSTKKPTDSAAPISNTAQDKTRGPEVIDTPKIISTPAAQPTEISSSFPNIITIENAKSYLAQDSNELSKLKKDHKNVTEPNDLVNNLSPIEKPIKRANNMTENLTNTIPKPFLNESTTSRSVQDLRNDNNTHNIEATKKDNEMVTSVTSSSLTDKKNTTEKSPIWFQADDQFFNKLLEGDNKRNLIYFLFLPPKPEEKKTTRTVFPNGTIVEEVVELTNKEDGLPKIIKSKAIPKNDSASLGE